MDLFGKINNSAVADARKKNIYPYFHELESRQDVAVIMEGKRRIMLGSNNYLGLTTHPRVIEAGVAAPEARNIEKAKLLYDYLDESKLFTGTAQKRDRSRMNVTFVTGDAALDAKFVKEAAAQGLVNLKGHRIVGGMRASIYNAMPVEGVQKLVDFMKQFETEN